MGKKIVGMLLAAGLLLSLTACGCKHEWLEATCVAPKTCAKCNAVEGDPAAHSWREMGCMVPKTCAGCGVSEGAPLGHDWQEATCIAPEKCARCKVTQGSALGHSWENSEVDASRRCTVCGFFEENRDPRFSAEAVKPLRGQWYLDTEFCGAWFGMDKTYDSLSCRLILELDSVGNGTLRAEFPDEKAFLKIYKRQFIKDTYAEFTYEGLTREETDLVLDRLYGMTMDQYAASEIENMTHEEIFGAFSRKLAYFVEAGDLHLSENWTGTFIPGQFQLHDATMKLQHPWISEDVLNWTQIPPA